MLKGMNVAYVNKIHRNNKMDKYKIFAVKILHQWTKEQESLKKGPTDSLTSCMFYYLNITKAAILSAAPVVMFNLVPGFPRRHTWNFSLSGKQPPTPPFTEDRGILEAVQTHINISLHTNMHIFLSQTDWKDNMLAHSQRKEEELLRS